MAQWSLLALATALLGLAGAAHGQDALRQAEAIMERWDGDDAYQLVRPLAEVRPQDPEVLALLTKSSLYRGQYDEAVRWAERWGEVAPQKAQAQAWKAFAEQTAWAVQGFKTYTSAHFMLTLDEARDGILAEYALAALERGYEVLERELGYRATLPVRVEIFPDHERFHAASSLSKRDIEVAGAVGICKFNKVMVLSPRVLLRGYRWLDAVVHEYVHYVIVKISHDKAPIWIHEGVAKHEESRWRSSASLYLNPVNRTLLAEALQSGDFVTFEQMEPSLVRLETPHQVQLAYAQAASTVDFILSRVGYVGLREIFQQMASTGDYGARGPIEQALGMAFTAFEEQWKQFLQGKNLAPVAGVQLAQYKVIENEAVDAVDADKLEQEALHSATVDRDLALGDLMRQRGRLDGAIFYYDRARRARPDTPLVLNKLGRALLAAQRPQDAVPQLQYALQIHPDYGTSHVTLGDAYRLLGEGEKARHHYEEAIQINPFNPLPHQYLVELLRQQGAEESAQREADIVRQLVGK
jgi:tetratricopeptide (TPR) repeat protein